MLQKWIKTDFIFWNNYPLFNYNMLNYFYLNNWICKNQLNFSFLLDSNSKNYYSEKTKKNFLLIENKLVFDENLIDDEIFNFLKKSSFIYFFINNLINVPICFKKFKSIKRRNNELRLLKLINFLMKKGKKEQYSKLFIKAIMLFYSFNDNKNLTFKNFSKFNSNWKNIFLLLNNAFNFFKFEFNTSITFVKNFKYELNFNNILINNGITFEEESFTKNFLNMHFFSISPLFNFFINNVDKNIKKFSRGKSGKYKFNWKYIPLYKRLNVTIKLLIKDIRFSIGKKLKNKIQNSLINLFFFPEKNFFKKIKFFSYNYVFKNYRKSLMLSLKTIK